MIRLIILKGGIYIMKKLLNCLLILCLLSVSFITNVSAQENNNTNESARIVATPLNVSFSKTITHNNYESDTTCYGYMVYKINVSGYITINSDHSVASRYDNVTLTKIDWEAPFEPYFNIIYSKIYYQNGNYYIKINIKCNLHTQSGSTYTVHSYTYKLTTSV